MFGLKYYVKFTEALEPSYRYVLSGERDAER